MILLLKIADSIFWQVVVGIIIVCIIVFIWTVVTGAVRMKAIEAWETIDKEFAGDIEDIAIMINRSEEDATKLYNLFLQGDYEAFKQYYNKTKPLI